MGTSSAVNAKQASTAAALALPKTIGSRILAVRTSPARFNLSCFESGAPMPFLLFKQVSSKCPTLRKVVILHSAQLLWRTRFPSNTVRRNARKRGQNRTLWGKRPPCRRPVYGPELDSAMFARSLLAYNRSNPVIALGLRQPGGDLVSIG